MKTDADIKPVLFTPEMVALMWCISVKTVYALINDGRLPHVVITNGNRKRLIRIRAAVAESWVLEHEQGGTPTDLPKNPRRRRRSILQPPKGVSVLNPLKNGGESANENSKNS
jgi:hypothetical protein